jgi:hypothetical protein
MILQATERAIQGLLQAAVDDVTGYPGSVPVLLSDESEVKPQMPYIVIQCVSAEEEITPESGIFKVAGDLEFKSHTKETSPETREMILDAINNFAYDSTATKLSALPGYHCHGWQPTSAAVTVDHEKKSYIYSLKYWVHCMALDNS